MATDAHAASRMPVPRAAVAEPGAAHRRWLYFGLLLAGLLADLALGVAETGWRAFVNSLAVPPEHSVWLVGLAACVTWINAFATLTGMLWPLVAAGLAMTAFVLVRWRRERNRLLRGRLALAVLAYFLLTATMPLVGSGFPVVPNPGGTGQPAWTAATGLSMLAFILLAILFGRGTYCGVICPAATYWSGLGQHFIRYNVRSQRTRRLAAITRIALLVLFATATGLSILDSFRLIHFSIFGNDPAVFFSGLVWMTVWFLMLVVVPFLGNRAFTRFLCPMGAFLGSVSQAGFFRVVSRDPQRCLHCTSHACSSTCEVSLDVGRALAQQGFLKSPACVGCGNCAAACPDGNIAYDNVFTWLRRAARGGTALPGASLPVERGA